MRKKTRNILISFSVLTLIIFSIFLISQNITNDRDSKMKLESIIGNSVFEVWNFYHDLGNLQDVDGNSIQEINNRLYRVESYSKVIDSGVSTELLVPIANKMNTQISAISSNYNETGEITEADQEIFNQLSQDARKISELITEVYYQNNIHQEGKIKLNITNYEELTKFK
ncbi:hypothetical protein [Paenibacillus lactis]|uniref:hypothetical protein n=1 Tax=Paenibacillus lactis TaxID=228574 RepID=UPI001AFCE585|nr:hypothetical protein [Paenibacillus lactis]GIO91398.1 hypothetical protein J31TS3_26250 [Paenibacillus lactis]